jgi:hypothetical protein
MHVTVTFLGIFLRYQESSWKPVTRVGEAVLLYCESVKMFANKYVWDYLCSFIKHADI